jgi:hypothetical protein
MRAQLGMGDEVCVGVYVCLWKPLFVSSFYVFEYAYAYCHTTAHDILVYSAPIPVQSD